MTKNDIYAALVRHGVGLGCDVIPEFRVHLAGGEPEIKKNLDLVWARRRPGMPPVQDRPSAEYWDIVAAFEVEGCDVRSFVHRKNGAKVREFDRHVAHFPLLENLGGSPPMYKAIILYTLAYDRNWNNHAPADYRDRQMRERQDWGRAAGIDVIDSRAADWDTRMLATIRALRG